MKRYIEVYGSEGRAAFGGLIRCGSVWLCPICASVVTEARRSELDKIITEANRLGLLVALQGYTVNHYRHDPLRKTTAEFLAAARAVKVGRLYEALRRKYGIVGTIRSLEVTYGRNGFHPHTHELVFLANTADLEGFASEMRSRWQYVSTRFGFNVGEPGYHCEATYGAVADYVSKWGHEPAVELPWGPAAEMAKWHIKQGRRKGRTPFQLLRDNLAGDHESGRLFVEYASVFKGRKQLVYSENLRAIILGDQLEEKTDEELVESQHEGLPLLGLITIDQWKVIYRNDAVAEIHNAAASGEWSEVEKVLAALGVSAFESRTRATT